MPEFETHAVGPEPIFGYQSLLELGRGGMGTVYLARATGTGGFERLIVIKRLHSHLTDQAQAVQRFLDEARVAACVRHANVVGTHQIGSDANGWLAFALGPERVSEPVRPTLDSSEGETYRRSAASVVGGGDGQ